MATETFKWRTLGKPGISPVYSVRESSFGDGYVQRAGEGVNNVSYSFDVEWVGEGDEMLLIRKFFDEHGGWKSFFWTSPFGELGLYICQTNTPSHLGGGLWRYDATFVQAFST